MDRRTMHIEGGNWDEDAQQRFDELQKDRQLHFARFCWTRMHETAPSGKTWATVFHEKEGMTLKQFKDMKDEDKQRKREG